MKGFNMTTLKHWLLLTAFSLVNSMVGMIYSIQAPFYPAEAMKRNATAMEYGLVFSSAEFSQIIGMPFIGTYVIRFGTMNAFILSILTASASTILFGFVNKIIDRIWFISVSCILRIINSFATGVVFVTMLVLINAVITGKTAVHMTIGQSMLSIGAAIGPVIGGILFDLGGFTAPFAVLGITQFVVAVFTRCILETTDYKTTEKYEPLNDDTNNKKNDEDFGYKRLLKIPSAILYNFCVMLSALNIAFVQTLLDAHLEQFNLTPVQIGLIFLSNGASLAVGFLFFGIISEKINQVNLIGIFGILSITVSGVIIGPDPFFSFGPKVWLIVLSLALSGFGRAATFVCANVLVLKDAVKNGFPDNNSTSALMAGLFLESVAIGMFVAPIIGGALFDHFGFRNSTIFLTTLNLLTMVVLITFNCWGLIRAPPKQINEADYKNNSFLYLHQKFEPK